MQKFEIGCRENSQRPPGSVLSLYMVHIIWTTLKFYPIVGWLVYKKLG